MVTEVSGEISGLKPYAHVVREAVRKAEEGELSLLELLRLVRYAAIVGALKESGGNVSGAARSLGVTRNVVTKWVAMAIEEGIELPLVRAGRRRLQA